MSVSFSIYTENTGLAVRTWTCEKSRYLGRRYSEPGSCVSLDIFIGRGTKLESRPLKIYCTGGGNAANPVPRETRKRSLSAAQEGTGGNSHV